MTRPMIFPRAFAFVVAAVVALAASTFAAEIWRPRPDFAPCFEVASGAVVHAIVVAPDGKFYVRGDFTLYDAASGAHANLVRFNADGSPDPSFNAALISGATSLMALQPGGGLVVVGDPGVVRLNFDGARDTSFERLAEFSVRPTSVAIQPDGKILLVGSFSRTSPRNSYVLVRLNGDGSLDGTFSPLSTAITLRAVALQADGKVLVGGESSSTSTGLFAGIERFNADGTLDSTFQPGAGSNGTISELVALPDGTILVGGDFSTFAGVSRPGLARLLANGALDPSFAPQPGVGTTFLSPVVSLVGLPDGRVLAACGKQDYNTVHIERFTATGAKDPTFVVGAGFRSAVNAVATLPDGRILAGGDSLGRLAETGANDPGFAPPLRQKTAPFYWARVPDGKWMVAEAYEFINGVPHKNDIVRLNADGTVDPTFTTSLRILHVAQPDGKILAGLPTGETVRLLVDGTIDPGFSLPFDLNTGYTPFLVMNDGRFLAVRRSGRSNDSNSTYSIVRRLADGSPDPTYTESGAPRGAGEWPGSILTNGFNPDGSVVFGGGAAIRRLLADGGRDESYNYRFFYWDYPIYAVAVLPTNDVIVAGTRHLFPGPGLLGNRFEFLQKVSADGLNDPAFPVTADFNNNVRALAIDSAGKIWASGDFTTHGPTPRSGIARLNSDGTLDDTVFFPGQTFFRSHRIPGLSLLSDDAIAFRGDWIGVGGRVFGGMAILERVTTPAITRQPASTSVQAGRSVTLTAEGLSTSSFTYQWRRNGVAIAGATSASYTLPSAQLFHAGDYTVVVSDAADSTTSSVAKLTVNAAPSTDSRVLNLSTRGYVGAGASIMIPGVVVSSEGAKTLLVRAVGPTLANFGVSGALADPVLTVFASDGSALFSNDDWQSNATSAQTAQVAAQLNAFPLPTGSKDAALVVTLQPGVYTVQISGVGGTTGIALAEVYVVP